jgi:hypothetical protein
MALKKLTAICMLGIALLALAACGGGKKQTASPTNTPPPATATTSSAATSVAATGTPAATEQPFQGARDPVDVPGPTAPPVVVLSDVRAAAHTDYDRITFQFDGAARPAYRVQYITRVQAVGCGSGEENTALPPLIGNAFLQVHFTPVDAHNDQGQSTIGATDLTPGLTTLQEARLTCDFEAVGNWVLGLSQEVDFRVLELDNPPRIAVDVAHP